MGVVTIILRNGVYTLITSEERLNQGDIIKGLPRVYQHSSQYTTNVDGSLNINSIRAKASPSDYSMILTNSCDMDNDNKLSDILLCPVVPLYSFLQKRRDEHYRNPHSSIENWDNYAEEFIQRMSNCERPRYHLLPESSIDNYDFDGEPVFLDFGIASILRLDFIKHFATHDPNNLNRITIYFSHNQESSNTLRFAVTRYANFMRRNLGILGI